MIFLIIGLLLGFIIGLYNDGILLGLVSSLIGFMVGICVLLTIGGLIGCYLPKQETTNVQQLYALSDSSSIQGEKFLFSGYINEKLKCRYVVNTDRGKHIKEINTDNMYVKEGNYQPKVITHSYKFKSDKFLWFAIDLSDKEWYEFCVPKGTVTNDYNIDLK